MDRNEKIEYIAEYFGLAQEQKIMEECGELITELSRLQQQRCPCQRLSWQRLGRHRQRYWFWPEKRDAGR